MVAAQLSWGEERFSTQEVPSRFLNAPRTVRIYLPPSYRVELGRRYPMLYLHDGQNVFTTAGTNTCFGWGNWELDKTVDELCRARKMREVILVAVNNTAARYAEYCGSHHPSDAKANTEYENYAAFLTRAALSTRAREKRFQSSPPRQPRQRLVPARKHRPDFVLLIHLRPTRLRQDVVCEE